MSDDGYEYDNEDDGMRAALERRRKPRHIEEAAAELEKETPSMGDAVDRARDEGGKDTFGVVSSLAPPKPPQLDAPAPKPYGPVEPPPPEPPSVAPPPEAPPEQPFKPNDFPVQTSAPAAPASNPRLSAINDLRSTIERLGSGALEPAGLGDADIAAAQGRDREQLRRDNFTRALSSGLLRQPYNPVEPREGTDLLARRQLEDQKAVRQASAQERLVAALKGEKDPGGLTEFQKYEMTRDDKLDKTKADAVATKKADDEKQLADDRKNFSKELTALGLDPSTASQKDVDRAIQLKNAEANQALAWATFENTKQHQTNEDVKALAASIGTDPANMQTIIDRLDKASSQPDIPGVGLVDKFVPDTFAGPEALQVRNDMRELVRAMLTAKSGKTVTPQEAADYAKIYGIDGSETAFRQGIQRLKQDVANTLSAKKAGFSPEAVKTYEGQGGTPTPTAPKSIVPQADPNEWVTVRRKDNGETIRKKRTDAEKLVSAHPNDLVIQ